MWQLIIIKYSNKKKKKRVIDTPKNSYRKVPRFFLKNVGLLTARQITTKLTEVYI